MHPPISSLCLCALVGFCCLGGNLAAAFQRPKAASPRLRDAAVRVADVEKISNSAPSFPDTLDDEDDFGYSVASLGDLDGDGIRDLAVGAPGDDDEGVNRGAVWVLFLENRLIR